MYDISLVSIIEGTDSNGDLEGPWPEYEIIVQRGREGALKMPTFNKLTKYINR